MKDFAKVTSWVTVLLIAGVILALCGVLSLAICIVERALVFVNNKILARYSNGLYNRAIATITELEEKEAS